MKGKGKVAEPEPIQAGQLASDGPGLTELKEPVVPTPESVHQDDESGLSNAGLKDTEKQHSQLESKVSATVSSTSPGESDPRDSDDDDKKSRSLWVSSVKLFCHTIY